MRPKPAIFAGWGSAGFSPPEVGTSVLGLPTCPRAGGNHQTRTFTACVSRFGDLNIAQVRTMRPIAAIFAGWGSGEFRLYKAGTSVWSLPTCPRARGNHQTRLFTACSGRFDDPKFAYMRPALAIFAGWGSAEFSPPEAGTSVPGLPTCPRAGGNHQTRTFTACVGRFGELEVRTMRPY